MRLSVVQQMADLAPEPIPRPPCRHVAALLGRRPLEPKKIKVNIDYEAEDKKSGFDPNAINLKLVELVRMVHGSFDSKPKLIDDFHEQHPECSKNSIERRLKDYFVKDRREDDPR